MLHIGCHLSTSGGFTRMGRDALSIGADTFAFFTRNPRGGRTRELDQADVQGLIDIMRAHGFAPLVAHAPYTLNLCSNREEVRQFARQTLADDLRRMEALPGSYLNFHPGSHMRQGVEAGVRMIADALNDILWEGMATTVLLETMAGKGTEVGGTFRELAAIIDQVNEPLRARLGVCLDTCHVHDAGYDLAGDLDGVLAVFDETIGLGRLRAVHLNDSKNPLGSHKDRHERIGQGDLGLDAFARIVTHPALRDLPFILETPNDLSGYAQEISLLRGLAG
ncbi:deoxyribonuclease IV [bacterium]|nr:deoxyribonuclease IV [bacterium]